jgi:hypothetical protein
VLGEVRQNDRCDEIKRGLRFSSELGMQLGTDVDPTLPLSHLATLTDNRIIICIPEKWDRLGLVKLAGFGGCR